jgi:hypothetical protein
MSFQFPANPADGDIVVRGNLQAFYNAATNTWRVSEVPTAPGIPGPPGPPGPIGPPGQGLEISGSVDTFANLPAPNTQQFKFWLVDDTNKVYYSDGTQWLDFGGPIQGPQGDPGEDGNDGINGQNGRGWYDTNIIDQRPTNYQVQFLSNDGLGFTTDNILGPKGDDGALEPADEDTCGCIKIGRGLDVDSSGTAAAGSTYVDLETTPLNPEGEPQGGYILNYIPQYSDFDEEGYTDDSVWSSQNLNQNNSIHTKSIEMTMPATANGALVYWFQNTNMENNPSKGVPPSGVQTYMGMYQAWLDVEGADWTTGNMGMNHYHHVAANRTSDGVAERDRATSILNTKTNELTFTPGGATVKFTRRFSRVRAAYIRMRFGITRLTVVPYRKEGGTIRKIFKNIPVPGDDLYVEPLTEEEILLIRADELRSLQRVAILDAQGILSLYPTYINDTEKAVLEQAVAELIAARDLPGTPDEIEDYLQERIATIDSMIQFKYRFEP